MRAHALDSDPDDYYLNKVLFPGVTASSRTQPGYGTFVYNSETKQAEELKLTFVNIQSTVGLPEETNYDELTWFEVDFEDKFMLQDLSAKSIAELVERLQND